MSYCRTAVAASLFLLAIFSIARADDSHWHVPAALPTDLWTKPKPHANPMTDAARGIQQSLQFSAASDLAYRGQSLTSGKGYASAGYGASWAPNKATLVGGGAFLVSKYDHGEMERPNYGYWSSAAGDTRFGRLAMNAFFFDIPNDDDMLSVEFGDEIERKIAKGVTLHASFAAAPDALSTFGNMLYLQSGLRIDASPATLGWSVRAHAGYQWIEDNEGFGTPDYADFEVTIARTWREIEISVTGAASDVARKDCFDGSRDCEARLLLTLAHTVSF